MVDKLVLFILLLVVSLNFELMWIGQQNRADQLQEFKDSLFTYKVIYLPVSYKEFVAEFKAQVNHTLFLGRGSSGAPMYFPSKDTIGYSPFLYTSVEGFWITGRDME